MSHYPVVVASTLNTALEDSRFKIIRFQLPPGAAAGWEQKKRVIIVGDWGNVSKTGNPAGALQL